MPARSDIPRVAYEKIVSGEVGTREAKRKYRIGHARFHRIRSGEETYPKVLPQQGRVLVRGRELPKEAIEEIRTGKIGVREAKRKYRIGQRIVEEIQRGEIEGVDYDDEYHEVFLELLRYYPHLFLYPDEYEILVAKRNYSFAHLRDYPRQLREIYTLAFHELLRRGYIQDIADMSISTPGKVGFVCHVRYILPERPKVDIGTRHNCTNACTQNNRIYHHRR